MKTIIYYRNAREIQRLPSERNIQYTYISTNIKFICMSFKNRKKRERETFGELLLTMHVYCDYHAMLKSPKQLLDCMNKR
jgi:hypothetical protein